MRCQVQTVLNVATRVVANIEDDAICIFKCLLHIVVCVVAPVACEFRVVDVYVGAVTILNKTVKNLAVDRCVELFVLHVLAQKTSIEVLGVAHAILIVVECLA